MWTRDQKLAFYAILVAILGILVACFWGFSALFTPEIRKAFKIEDNSNLTAKSSQTLNPEPTLPINKPIPENPSLSTQSFTQPNSSNEFTENTKVSGSWKGNWSSEGRIYSANVELFDESSGSIKGKIIWTLEDTPNIQRASKIGATAIEYVEGVIDSRNNSVKLFGTTKDDPNGIIILDKYNLNFSPKNQTLDGYSFGGKKKGNFQLNR